MSERKPGGFHTSHKSNWSCKNCSTQWGVKVRRMKTSDLSPLSLQAQAQCVALKEDSLNDTPCLVLLFGPVHSIQVPFTGTNSSPSLMGTSSPRLRLKPRKRSSTLPSDLLASSMTQALPKSSVTVAIPSTLTLMTRRTNQVGFFWWGRE